MADGDLVWTLPAQPNQTARWSEPTGGGGGSSGMSVVTTPIVYTNDSFWVDGEPLTVVDLVDGQIVFDIFLVVTTAFDGAPGAPLAACYFGASNFIFTPRSWRFDADSSLVEPLLIDTDTPSTYAAKSMATEGALQTLSRIMPAVAVGPVSVVMYADNSYPDLTQGDGTVNAFVYTPA